MSMVLQKNVQSGVGSVGEVLSVGVETAATSIETIFESGQDLKQRGRGCRVGWIGNTM